MPVPVTSTTPTIAARPTGVTVLAILAILAGSIAILLGLALIAAGTFASVLGVNADTRVLDVIGAVGAGAGVLVILYGIFDLAVAYGLFTRRRWAWYAAIVIVILQALQALGSLVAGDFVSAIVGFAIVGLVVWYLLSPPVQSWFGVSYKAPWTYRQPPPHA